jgi:hypothetical protein
LLLGSGGGGKISSDTGKWILDTVAYNRIAPEVVKLLLGLARNTSTAMARLYFILEHQDLNIYS